MQAVVDEIVFGNVDALKVVWNLKLVVVYFYPLIRLTDSLLLNSIQEIGIWGSF